MSEFWQGMLLGGAICSLTGFLLSMFLDRTSYHFVVWQMMRSEKRNQEKIDDLIKRKFGGVMHE